MVVIIGSSCSVCSSAVAVVAGHKNRFSVSLLAASSSHSKLARQGEQTGAGAFYLDDPRARERIKNRLLSRGRRLISAREELFDFLGREKFDIALVTFSDFEMSALALEALFRRRDRPLKVLVASKEPIVAFGDYFRELAFDNGHKIIPLDSEPSAIFQCLGGSLETRGQVRKIYLTATGGPFYNKSIDPDSITPRMALDHPKWKMGPKITIDSATLLNKALELMEIAHLFRVPTELIKVVVHPECVVHSMVEMKNSSILAQLGPATMKLPIQYGLFWPEGFAQNGLNRRVAIGDFRNLTFAPPDLKRFPCLNFALRIARIKDEGERVVSRLALLGADQGAVELFLGGRVPFARIASILHNTVYSSKRRYLNDYPAGRASRIRFGLEVYKWAKDKVLKGS